jgi:hypothetical protein
MTVKPKPDIASDCNALALANPNGTRGVPGGVVMILPMSHFGAGATCRFAQTFDSTALAIMA